MDTHLKDILRGLFLHSETTVCRFRGSRGGELFPMGDSRTCAVCLPTALHQVRLVGGAGEPAPPRNLQNATDQSLQTD